MTVVKLEAPETPKKPAPKFACGAVVQLASGGHFMTVRSAARHVTVEWLTDQGELTTAAFPPAMLVSAPPDAQGDADGEA